MMNIVKKENCRKPVVNRYRNPFDLFFGDMDRIFEDFLPRGRSMLNNRSGMDVDVIEDDEKFTLAAALPGLSEDELSVTVENRMLTISAEKKDDSETKEKNYYRREIGYGKMERRFSLPENISGEEISAEYKNGVLEVILPKTEQGNRRHEVEIRTA